MKGMEKLGNDEEKAAKDDQGLNGWGADETSNFEQLGKAALRALQQVGGRFALRKRTGPTGLRPMKR